MGKRRRTISPSAGDEYRVYVDEEGRVVVVKR